MAALTTLSHYVLYVADSVRHTEIQHDFINNSVQ